LLSLYGGAASLPGVAAPAGNSTTNSTTTPAPESNNSIVTLPEGADSSKGVSLPAGVSPANPSAPKNEPVSLTDLGGSVNKTGIVSLAPKTPGEKSAASMKTPGEVSQSPITPTAAGAVNVTDSSKGYTDSNALVAAARFLGDGYRGRVYFAPPQNDKVQVQIDLIGLPKGSYYFAVHEKPATNGCESVGSKYCLIHFNLPIFQILTLTQI
jgi:hypothetical protein